MDQDKDWGLISRLRNSHDSLSKEELVKKYLPMVRFIVKNYHIPIMDFEDFLQEGLIGLLKAIDEYDPEHNAVKFSTFAYTCILRRIYNIIKGFYVKKAVPPAQLISLYSGSNNEEFRNLLDAIPDLSMEPFFQVENKWNQQKLETVLQAYLSPIEFQVVHFILLGYNINEITKILSLTVKAIDNARTRARLKLKKIILLYGSLLNPKIPLKTKKRKDLAIEFITHPA